MAPTKEMQDKALDALALVQLEEFKLSPTSILPFQKATLKWRVTTPAPSETGVNVVIRLSAPGIKSNVAKIGARVVSPAQTTTYTLEAICLGMSKMLGSHTLTVDASACLSLSLPQAEVSTRISQIVDEFMATKPELSRRHPDVVEISPTGIRIKLRFVASIDKWADPDVNIDALVKLRVENGDLKHTITSYSFDIDFPLWADALTSTLLPAWLALALKENSESQETRQVINDGIESTLNDMEGLAEGYGYKFLSIATADNEIRYTLCPSPVSTPVSVNPSVIS
jgi:hypothetical protein